MCLCQNMQRLDNGRIASDSYGFYLTDDVDYPYAIMNCNGVIMKFQRQVSRYIKIYQERSHKTVYFSESHGYLDQRSTLKLGYNPAYITLS